MIVSYYIAELIKYLLNLMTEMLESIDMHSQKNPALCNELS